MSAPQLHGWHAVAVIAIGAIVAVIGALYDKTALLMLGGATITGVIGVAQPWRPAYARTRSSDRRTRPEGIPFGPEDVTPRPQPQKEPPK